ncbi:lipase maturation factor 2-like [Trichogramma pretiosum]|uniref:lipase maturation factor 2-like n=1 Tax=Trichogramma pretiosum TaxID=7493 RepID=UPI0006C9C61B|nr:lipase maturation factor 2-like [Trichogramma pretiosum]
MTPVRYTRNLFLRGVSVVYLFAFLSFYVQIPGLYGDNGLLPARIQLDLTNQAPLLKKLQEQPNILWFASYLGLNVEYMLDLVTLLGISFSFLGLVSQKLCTAPVFFLLWSFYYSIYQIGKTFMWFQWDLLLLETGILSIIIAPIRYNSRSRKSAASDSLRFWTIRWLLFRLIFTTGIIKLISGCPLWWSLDALKVYFQSQVLPTPLAWNAYHLPTWYLRFINVFTNIHEIVIPFLFFIPIRMIRTIACILLVHLQIHILCTGNYNFYNLLTIILCLSLLNDQFFYRKKFKNENSEMSRYFSIFTCIAICAAIIYGTVVFYNLKFTNEMTISSKIGFTRDQFDHVLARAIPISVYIAVVSLGFTVAKSITQSIVESKGLKKKFTSTLTTLIYAIIVTFWFTLSIVPYIQSVNPKLSSNLPTELKKIHAKLDSFHLVNSYGLFKKMTGATGRPELIIEGSNDISGPWKEYHFLYKPGNVNNSLPFVAPHQPRLDWQMWFATMGSYHQNPWLMSLAYRILNGQPEVLALMNENQNPFRQHPPKYLRAYLYNYTYTVPLKGKKLNSWWVRERKNEYLPIFSRDHPPLIEYLTNMKVIISSNNHPKVTNKTLKIALDLIRSLVNKVEPPLLLWGFFTAGCAIVMTG